MSEWVKAGDIGFTSEGIPTKVKYVKGIKVWFDDPVSGNELFCHKDTWTSRILEKATGSTILGAPSYTGGSSDYYKVEVKNTTSGGKPYLAECNDIIEALGMNFAEGNAFKALWRRAAHRTLGLKKAGAKDDGLYDAEKVKFFGERLVEQSKVGK